MNIRGLHSRSQAFSMTLTYSHDNLTLSRNQINVPISAMSNALHSLGVKICRVSFFGMKWEIPDVEPVIDRFMQQYRAKMGFYVPTEKNMFDYGVQFPIGGLQLYKFNEVQCEARRFKEGTMHEMCNVQGYASLDFCCGQQLTQKLEITLEISELKQIQQLTQH